MTACQSIKLTDMVSDYPVSDGDNLRHINNIKGPSEDATKQEERGNGSPPDHKRAEKNSGGAQSPPEQPSNALSQPPEEHSSGKNH